jgi:hypothetical protein
MNLKFFDLYLNLNMSDKNESDKNENENVNVNNKKPLDIYYYIDVKLDQDINIIERCLRINLNVNNNNEYEIDKFVNCSNVIKNDTEKNNEDVIKRGLMTFNNMVSSLKLKSTNDTWLLYISNGNINKLYEDVFVILLNKEPMFKKSYYIISKNSIDINKQSNKRDKMENLKLFNRNLQELLRSEKQITYTNLD